MESLDVVMIREDLENLPHLPLPIGFSMRKYQQGDRATWVCLQTAAETHLRITEELFGEQFG
ncbi:MAG: hypothetical protein ACYSTL_00205, partial [Planctomycetota bacterium]